MKKVLALMLALLILALCACGQDTATGSAQIGPNGETGAQNAEKQQEQAGELTADGYYKQEKTLDDGTVVTIYRDGGPEGAIVKGSVKYLDGSRSDEKYFSDGTVEHMLWTDADGNTGETYYYPSGNTEKSITKSVDGTYSEIHYMDNGYFDEKTGTNYDGTITYLKFIDSNGYVDERTFDVAEDGTRWDSEEWEDGTIVKTHYGINGMTIEQIQENEKTGNRTEIKFFENGNEKSRDTHSAEHGYTLKMEYYESGIVKHSLLVYDDGSHTREEKVNETGYTTYYHESGNGLDMEFFADDNGELIKYVDKGTVYEGDAIPGIARNTFNQVRQVPAQDTTTTQNEDGSTATTITYADGSTVTNGTTADGCTFNESISANGERNYEEYYASGKLRFIRYETADTFQETHYDEEGYYTYFHYIAPGYELEITCDETGKVNKVLLNDVEQTDIESIVKDMFFRSW